jgi:hypothetical protein
MTVRGAHWGLPVVAFTLVATLVGGTSRARAADETISYSIAGDYLEGCACRLVCPCDLGEDAAAMKGCQATFVWHIEKGRYGDIGLDGLTMIGMILKPEKNYSAAVGKMEWGLYVDANADAKQRAALQAIFRARYGSQFATLRGPKFVAITFVKKTTDTEGLADEYLVEIPHLLSLKNAVFKDESGKRTVRLNSPGAMIPTYYYAKAVQHTYRDKDWKTSWDFAGRQSFYGKFDYTK